MIKLQELKIGVVGLGYVGLPLAVEFGKTREVVGFDIDKARLTQLTAGGDVTGEVSEKDLGAATHLSFSDNIAVLRSCNCFIVTVPTPINSNKEPDLNPLLSATNTVASVLKPGDIVVYESTVFPGCTEELCVPLLEKISNLTFNRDFFCGYSPERINPGDKLHRLPDIIKVTSGSTEEVANLITDLYSTIINAGIHRAKSIKIAEAAKVIENTQRDLNIALMNELSQIFAKMNIDTKSVLEAASTKWNFIPFQPGLVGGHCIGVDPYYLTFKAREVGYEPSIILAGREVNDGMGGYIADKVCEKVSQDQPQSSPRALILGLTFKENCPDTRNTRVVDIAERLFRRGVAVEIYDPWVEANRINKTEYFELVDEIKPNRYEAVIIAVAHQIFREYGSQFIKELGKIGAVIYDVKGLFPEETEWERL